MNEGMDLSKCYIMKTLFKTICKVTLLTAGCLGGALCTTSCDKWFRDRVVEKSFSFIVDEDEMTSKEYVKGATPVDIEFKANRRDELLVKVPEIVPKGGECVSESLRKVKISSVILNFRYFSTLGGAADIIWKTII